MKPFLKFAKGFSHGFSAYFRGLAFSIKEKSLRRVVATSVLANIVIFAVILKLLFGKMTLFLSAHLSLPVFWYQYILFYSAKFLATIFVFIICVFIVYLVSSVLLMGWGKYLSMQTLKLKFQFLGSLKAHVREGHGGVSIGHSILKAVIITVLSGLGFLIALVPGLGWSGIMLSSLVLTFDMMDYGFESGGLGRVLTIKERLSFFKLHFPHILGFAFGLTAIMAVPVINVVMLPSSVVAANFLLAEIKGPIERSNP